ncbi:hypothetical protein [Brevifollis gellanilyticus]|uniref:Glycosyl hydrolase-like 10 domain-containing protein n=1 Tax=Brevifollis gellanilyticus TaxID=748831 RepID=A0A512MEK6_9BACT|nr:hypothetical protein [Brevifollis gellanilyticus]GEP45138.1 hypothetical protein BGE01nite_44290 [Brevifollis gellanilyticus]
MKLFLPLLFLCSWCLSRAAEPLVLMQNLDGDLSFVGDTPEESRDKLQKLVGAIADGPVKSLMWSIGAGSDVLYYQTRVASTWGWRFTKYNKDPKWEKRIERCRIATEAGLDAPRIVGEVARARGLRFYPSYRMNDAHYCSDPLYYPLTGRFWMEHQDATLGTTPVQGAEVYQHLLNYAREEVRAYRLGVIVEAMNRYADLMDGFELDFNRFQVFFPPGQAEPNMHLLTEMVQKAREELNRISKEQKRPMKLIVRVPPAVKNCTWAGIDLATWIKGHLVDAIIPTQVMTLAHDMPLEEFVALAKPEGIEVIGSLYGRSGYHWPFSAEHTEASYMKEVSRTPDAAKFLGAALNQRQMGASGHQIYNYILHTDPLTVKALSTQQGSRRYCITTAYFHDHLDTYEYRKQLPAFLGVDGKVTLRVMMGENPAKAHARAYLRLGLNGANQKYDDVKMTVTLNGETFHEGSTAAQMVVTKGLRHGISCSPATEAYVQWPVKDASLLKQGWNTIEISLQAASQPLEVVETEITLLPP